MTQTRLTHANSWWRSLNHVARFQAPYFKVILPQDMQSVRPPIMWRNEWHPNVYAPIRTAFSVSTREPTPMPGFPSQKNETSASYERMKTKRTAKYIA